MRRRCAYLVSILAAAVVFAGCGGPTREEWVASITPTCDRIHTIGQSIRMEQGMQPTEIATNLDAALVKVTPLIAELKAAKRPKDDPEVEKWIALQDEGLVVMRNLSTAFRSSNRMQVEAAGVQVADYTRRDKAAAQAVGAPGSCSD